jgi:hypothetical protein
MQIEWANPYLANPFEPLLHNTKFSIAHRVNDTCG